MSGDGMPGGEDDLPTDGLPAIVANVRDPRVLGPLIGRRLVDVTQHEPGEAFCLHLLFEDGTCLSIPVGDGGFRVTHPTSGA